MARILIIALAVAFALGGLGAALGNSGGSDGSEPILLDPARKDDVDGQVTGTAADDDDNDGDGDGTAGNDGTSGGNNTAAPAAVPRGDGDATAGNDGTSGGDNTAPKAAPAPAPAPLAAGDGDSTAGNDGTSGGPAPEILERLLEGLRAR